MITSASKAMLDELVNKLTEVYKELTVNRGKKLSYVGMTFDFTSTGKVKLTMEGYGNDILSSYGVEGKASSPALEHLFHVREGIALLDEEQRCHFHSRVAKILYLAKRVRCDLLTAIVFLTMRVLVADVDDWEKLNRVLKYLNATPNIGLVLEPSNNIFVDAYVDASYGVHDGRQSHTGVFITLGKGAIYVKSAKQKLVSKLSTEAELIGLSDSSSQVIWTREFLIAQGYDLDAAKIRQDNKSTMALVEKGRSTSERTRHISIRYFFIKDRVDRGELSIEYTPTGDMVADILTKPLQVDLFRRMRAALLNWHDG